MATARDVLNAPSRCETVTPPRELSSPWSVPHPDLPGSGRAPYRIVARNAQNNRGPTSPLLTDGAPVSVEDAGWPTAPFAAEFANGYEDAARMPRDMIQRMLAPDMRRIYFHPKHYGFQRQ